jgi:regulator of replication initiation timing
MQTTLDIQPIDRLEEKVKLLVGAVERLRTERAAAVEESTRLTRELETARGRIADLERATAEIGTLREEREVVKTRVSEMLQQLDGLQL